MSNASTTATTTGGSSHQIKTTSRGSIRHSLGFASMGKALADVIGSGSGVKESKTQSRRQSLKPTAPEDTAQKLAPRKESPELVKTVTRKRASMQLERPSIDQPSRVPNPTVASNTVGAGLRPRGSGASSALPKYRPKSQLVEKPKEPPSPPRTGTRRRLSSSDDESGDQKPESKPKDTDMLNALIDKTSRPISPLPRKSKKVDLSNAMKVTPSGLPSMSKKSDLKASKGASIPQRPSSAASTSPSPTPHTPKSSLRVALGLKSSKTPDGSPNPFRASRERAESPLSKHSRNPSKDSQNLTPKHSAKEPPHIILPSGRRRTTGSSSDTDDSSEDVAELLAPVAPSTAPTPAMPRLHSSQNRKRLVPTTPTRNNPLPNRENLSYVSPLATSSPSPRLKPPSQKSDSLARGSLFSWEHMVENSITLEADELGKMLSDTAAPFCPDPMSPTLSVAMEIPDSPCLSSPGGYGAISHVRLPDVTPSPAVHLNTSQRFNDAVANASTNDTNTIYQLRLQLESARNTAQERLNTLMRLEHELEISKASRAKEVEELSKQVAALEGKMVDGLEAQRRSKEAQTCLLQAHQRDREQAVKEAKLRATEKAEKTHAAHVERLRRQFDSSCAARVAATEWNAVKGVAHAELDFVRGSRDMLGVLKLELDRLQATIS